MKFVPQKPAIYAETPESLKQKLKEAGEAAYRADQIIHWLYKKRVRSWDAMVNIPQKVRTWLDENFTLMPVKVELVKKANDITEKLLLRLEDNSFVETVLIRYPQEGVGQDTSRKTICVSTQVGCAYGCKFCASGLEGWKRDLSMGEIVAQVMQICFLEEDRGEPGSDGNVPFDNIVIMGMGEPLANYDNLIPALKTVNADWGLKFGARRVTVSTSGLVPQIRRLSEEQTQFRLAISLHGATNEVRQQIMPVNRKYPLEQLIPAVQEFAEKHGRMLTFEYILIEDINDTLDQADHLIEIARSVRAHVNLIPYNKVEGLPWKRPNITRQNVFFKKLKDAGVSVTIRKEKGHDISAACGQLRLKKEREEREKVEV